jgi:hypothetical protein
VIDVQMGLNDVPNRVRPDVEAAQLGSAVLSLGHPDLEKVRQRPPMGAGIVSDRQRIAAVDDDIPLRVAHQKEWHRNHDACEPERAALEQVELDAAHHALIVWRHRSTVGNAASGLTTLTRISCVAAFRDWG